MASKLRKKKEKMNQNEAQLNRDLLRQANEKLGISEKLANNSNRDDMLSVSGKSAFKGAPAY